MNWAASASPDRTSRNDDVKRFVDATMARFGRIDVLVNSAGHGPRAPLLDITDEGWHQGIDIYFLSAVRPTRLVTPIMEAQGTGGSIINITTFATFEPDPLFPTSGVARAGLAAFTKLFADKYAPQGIRMNNVLPGFINSLPEKHEFRARIPMGRYGDVSEIAGTVAFLASDAAGYITGQNLRVDGGVTGRSDHVQAPHHTGRLQPSRPLSGRGVSSADAVDP